MYNYRQHDLTEATARFLEYADRRLDELSLARDIALYEYHDVNDAEDYEYEARELWWKAFGD